MQKNFGNRAAQGALYLHCRALVGQRVRRCVPAITAFFDGTGFEYYDNIIANRMDEHGGIKNHPTALKESFEKGQTVVRVLEKLKDEWSAEK